MIVLDNRERIRFIKFAIVYDVIKFAIVYDVIKFAIVTFIKYLLCPKIVCLVKC